MTQPPNPRRLSTIPAYASATVEWANYPFTGEGDHNTIGVLRGTRLRRIIRHTDGWLVWIATMDFRYGTYLMLYNDGRIVRVTAREDQGDEVIVVRPRDAQ